MDATQQSETEFRAAPATLLSEMGRE